jgi:hypothetical protein
VRSSWLDPRWLAITTMLASACGPITDGTAAQPIEVQGNVMDPSPALTFTQVARAVGIDRSKEPASAGTYSPTGTLAYGGWLADLDGDARLDYYAVNHGQWPHLSGLFVNSGAGGFGKNLFTVSLQPSSESWPSMGTSNEVSFVGDLTGDGRVDFFFKGWSGIGVMCANRGVVSGPDWTGPGYTCFGTTDALAFADVNGDGRIDILALSPSGFDTYAAHYSHTGAYLWRLNNGTPNLQTWPTTQSFLALRVTDPSSPSPPFVDLNGDGIPDKIVGIPLPSGSRGTYGTLTAGKQVYLGQPSGSYALQSATGLEAATEPITRIEDVNDDGCLDLGTDQTGYRDNQSWYVQDKAGASCSVTFTFTPRTAFPYYPGSKRYTVDIDNSGLLSKVVIIHKGYGNNDGRPGGVTIYRKLPDGTYTAIPPVQSGININGTYSSEFYADNLSPGDWNDDGRLDLAGTGTSTIADTDSGFALWTSGLATTNGWIKVSLPTVTGFFTGSATLEVFDAGFVGDPAHRVTPSRTLHAGRVWASQVYHLGIGTRTAVDVRVTFPGGEQTVRAGVVPGSRITIEPIPGLPPVAVATASPTSASVGQPVSFDGSASSDPDGSIVQYAWAFGDGAGASGASASHAYASAGAFVAKLTVTDDDGATATAAVTILVVDTTPPTVGLGSSVFTPSVSEDVVKVEWYLDDVLSATAIAPPFSYALSLTPVSGSHTLRARAYDAAGNAADTAPLLLQK